MDREIAVNPQFVQKVSTVPVSPSVLLWGLFHWNKKLFKKNLHFSLLTLEHRNQETYSYMYKIRYGIIIIM